MLTNDPTPRWHARPRLAAATRAFAFVVPLITSASFVYVGGSVLPPPTGSTWAFVLWWGGLSAAATVVLALTGRLTRRLLPLAALMRLSLVFPDTAPSRFRVALRTGTVQTLDERLAATKGNGRAVAPAAAARLLLGLVAMLDTHDRLTRGHSERVRAYARAIGRELGLDPDHLDRLNWAALLHDVGKLEMPTETLTKEGRPSEDEWTLIRRHPELGDALIAPLREWLGPWSAAVAEHHERWDGTGYPRGLASHEISLAGRIVAAADVFDVITSARCYKEARGAAVAREEITRCAGTQFDPDVVRAFLAMSVRRGRSTRMLVWLAQAPVLARLALTPATAVSAAAVALGAGTLGVVDSPARLTSDARTSRPAAAAVERRALRVIRPVVTERGTTRPSVAPVLGRAASNGPATRRPARVPAVVLRPGLAAEPAPEGGLTPMPETAPETVPVGETAPVELEQSLVAEHP